jgi:drug/metabolite transporter (DMT)-like permease
MPVAVATIIYATNPIYTAILGYFLLKEPYHPRYALGLGLCLIGIYLAIRHKLSDQVIATEGLIYMFMTAFFYSCYMTLAKKMRLNLPNTQFNFFLNLIAALIAFTLLTVVNLSAEQNIVWIGFPASQWGVILALAIFPSLLGHTLMIYAIKEYNLNFVSIFKLLNPLIGAVLAYFIFGESISMGFWAGFVFVLSGVLLSLR